MATYLSNDIAANRRNSVMPKMKYKNNWTKQPVTEIVFSPDARLNKTLGMTEEVKPISKSEKFGIK